MQKRLTNAVVIALALFLAVGFGAAVWRASNAPHPAVRASGVIQNDRGSDAKAESPEEAIARYNKWLAIFTLILAIATIGLGGATAGLYLSGQNQIELARQEFLSSHRPKIAVKHVWFRSTLTYKTPIIASVTCINAGTSDAFFFEYGAGFFVITGHHLALPVDPAWPITGNLKGFRLESGISVAMPDLTGTIDALQEREIRAGTMRLFCAGYVHYRDGLGKNRTTAFCRLLEPTTDGSRFAIIKDCNPDYEYAY